MPQVIARRDVIAGLAVSSVATPAAAHHGWGSYDANAVFTIEGPILAATYENPHGEVEIAHGGKRWTCTLAPPFRMQNRGLPPDMLKIGASAKIVGYPSRVKDAEMRAERITIADKTIELR